MPKYRVYGIVTGYIILGVHEAPSKAEARDRAIAEHEEDLHCVLCHQCENKYQMDADVTKFLVEEDE